MILLFGAMVTKITVPFSVLENIKLKRMTYSSYRTTENYNAYAHARNQVKCALRKATKEKELSIAKNIRNSLITLPHKLNLKK